MSSHPAIPSMVCFLVFFCAAGGIAAAGDTSTQAKLSPSQLALFPGEEAELLLALVRPAGEPAEVSWQLRSRCGLELAGPAEARARVSTRVAAVVSLRVRASAGACEETAYLALISGEESRQPEVQLLPIQVARPSLEPAQVVSVARIPEPAAEGTDLKPEVVFFWRIRNLFSGPITIRNPTLRVYGAGVPDGSPKGRPDLASAAPLPARWCNHGGEASADASGEPPCVQDFPLPVGGELSLPVVLRASMADTQEQSMIVLRAQAEYVDRGNPRSVAIDEVTTAALGYRDLKALPAALSLPSLLFLPGILLLIFSRWAAGKPQLFELGLASWIPKILIPAATLSILFAIGYSFAIQRNLLTGFSVRDVAYVWASTLLLGTLAGLAYQASEWFKKRDLEENRPAPSDPPGEILRKAIWSRSDFRLYVPQDSENFKSWHESCWFLIAETKEGKWLAPVIEASLDPLDERGRPGESAGSSALRRELARLCCRPPFWRRFFLRQKERLAHRLQEAEAASEVFLRWSGHRFPKLEPAASFRAGSSTALRLVDTDLRSFFELKPLAPFTAERGPS